MPGRGNPRAERRVKTSLVLPESLWIRLKVAAAEERTDVSAILCRLAEQYLKTRKGGRG
jgi:hypothetical protein